MDTYAVDAHAYPYESLANHSSCSIPTHQRYLGLPKEWFSTKMMVQYRKDGSVPKGWLNAKEIVQFQKDGSVPKGCLSIKRMVQLRGWFSTKRMIQYQKDSSVPKGWFSTKRMVQWAPCSPLWGHRITGSSCEYVRQSRPDSGRI